MTQQPGARLAALIDREQLARKLEIRLGEVVSHAQQEGFPSPVAYFRGRMLWDEAAVDEWLGDRRNT
jgi:predicted DNA-binding transcriptional regulator AlpA